MRPEHPDQLAALAEHLITLAIAEADPQCWAGHGVAPFAMDKDTRAERDWCKKNAASTLALIVKIHSLASRARGGEEVEEGESEEDRELLREMAEAERLAAHRLGKVR